MINAMVSWISSRIMTVGVLEVLEICAGRRARRIDHLLDRLGKRYREEESNRRVAKMCRGSLFIKVL